MRRASSRMIIRLKCGTLPISTMKPFPWAAYAMGAAAVLTAAWLVGRMRLPRLLLWVVTTGALILMDLGFIGM